MRKQLSACTRRDKELMEHRSNHVRPEPHDTSTAIPDLHEGNTIFGATTDGTKEQITETAVGCLYKAPKETRSVETAICTGQQGQTDNAHES
ncbi:hypothetical protein Taro_010838 [Colocasia esculenta]|uniref:Uncharacterized protein n=1 Tax=Colocasia esculenta TaxID=4460 RepID=A0A843U9C3_COLES|nr:hypothetical protein [Colocasia esculenta]